MCSEFIPAKHMTPSTPFRFLAMLSLSVVFAVTSADASDEGKSDLDFDFDITTLHSEDFGDFTPALSYHFKWTFLDDELPWKYTSARFEANGTLALDAALNRDPLVTETDFLWSGMVLEDWAGKYSTAHPGRDVDAPLLEAGFTARYETDQQMDNRNGVMSAFVAFNHDNPYRWLGIVPSVLVAYDGVLADTSQAAKLGADNPNHSRLRAEATWRFGLSNVSQMKLLRASMISAHLQYSKDFGVSDKMKVAGLDESFGAAVEYAWMFDTGVKKDDSAYSSPKYFFVRASFGRVAPEPENDTSIIAGFRIGIDDKRTVNLR